MMRKRYVVAIAIASATTLVLTACGSSKSSSKSSSSASSTASATPVPGGTLKITEPQEPRSVDPAILNNVGGSYNPTMGNALYGTLIQGDSLTSQWTPSMATNLATTDDGKTWTLTLRSGIVYSDGTPMTAADVVANWNHIASPTAGSASIGDALGFTSVATGPLTVVATMKAQNIHFPTVIMESDLNWVAKPAALALGQSAFDANPIGAGPFTLQSWQRGASMTVVKNPKYWDAPRPYLDKITFNWIVDPTQRENATATGATDLTLEGNWGNVIKAQSNKSLQVNSLAYGGGTGLAFNNTAAPFNNPIARQAVSDALDLSLIDTAVNGVSTGQVPTTYFNKGTAYYQNIPLTTQNQQKAQDLFNQYFAQTGKPVEFTITMFGTTSQPMAESVQTQLAGYKNVIVHAKVADIAQYATITGPKRQFDAVTTSLTPTRLCLRLQSTSTGNTSGFSNPDMDAACNTINTSPDQAAQKSAWTSVQNILASQDPYLLYQRLSLSTIAKTSVQGITQYGFGSVPVDKIWLKQ